VAGIVNTFVVDPFAISSHVDPADPSNVATGLILLNTSLTAIKS
jgi:hypothetical protein